MLDADKLQALSKKFDCSIELYSETASGLVLSAERDNIHAKDSTFTEGFALRTIRDKQLGFYAFEKAEESEDAVRKSIKLGKLQEKAEYFFPGKKGSSRKYFDRRCLNLADWGAEHLQEMLEVQKEQKVKPVQNLIGATHLQKSLINSEGAAIQQDFSHFFAISQCGYKETEADDSGSSAKFVFSPGKVALNAANFAKASADAKKTSAGKMQVVFDIRAVYHLLPLFLRFNFSGETHRKKLSLLKKTGAFAAENISIADDPSLAAGIKPSEYDDEGFESRKKFLVQKGKVREFIYDMQIAAKLKNKNAGNGLRSSFNFPPSHSFSNISIEGGKEEDLLKDCRRGIYVNSFLTSGANPVTGDFSFPLLIAFEIQDGEPRNAIKGVMMKGNFFNLMKNAKFERETSVFNGLKSGRLSADLEIVA